MLPAGNWYCQMASSDFSLAMTGQSKKDLRGIKQRLGEVEKRAKLANSWTQGLCADVESLKSRTDTSKMAGGSTSTGTVPEILTSISEDISILELKVNAILTSLNNFATIYLAQFCANFQKHVCGYVMLGRTDLTREELKEPANITDLYEKYIKNDLNPESIQRWIRISKLFRWKWKTRPREQNDKNDECWFTKEGEVNRRNTPVEIGYIKQITDKRNLIAHPEVDYGTAEKAHKILGLLVADEGFKKIFSVFESLMQLSVKTN